jgi:hypothetical protein
VRVGPPGQHEQHTEQAEGLRDAEAVAGRAGHRDREGQQQRAQRQDQCDFRQTGRSLLVLGQPDRGRGDRHQDLREHRAGLGQARHQVEDAQHGHHQEHR